MNIIFLDIDGVLNCQTFYETRQKGGTYVENMICKERVSWFNGLCTDVDAKVVISSSWRLGKKIEEMKEIFAEVGGTFEIIGMTPNLKHEACVRGNEILQWIKDNEAILGSYFDYKTYAIIDDDSDMLLWQAENFFKVDHYSGLTPNTCYKIKRFFEGLKCFTV